MNVNGCGICHSISECISIWYVKCGSGNSSTTDYFNGDYCTFNYCDCNDIQIVSFDDNEDDSQCIDIVSDDLVGYGASEMLIWIIIILGAICVLSLIVIIWFLNVKKRNKAMTVAVDIVTKNTTANMSTTSQTTLYSDAPPMRAVGNVNPSGVMSAVNESDNHTSNLIGIGNEMPAIVEIEVSNLG